MSARRRLSAIDMGTVTTRLLIADVSEDSVDEVVRRSVITHLGEGLERSGRLAEPAIERVVSTVAGYLEEIRAAGSEEPVALATSAARDAENANVLLAELAGLGVRPRVILGEEEARLSFLGATFGLEAEDVLVADPGGGSTELILGSASGRGAERRATIEASRSVDVGARRMTERFLAGDPPRKTQLEAARVWAVASFKPFFTSLRDRPSRLVTLAGSATSLSAVKQGLEDYDPTKVHGSELTGADLAELLDELASMTLEERRHVVGLEPERASVIVAGTLIIETVLGLAGLHSTVVSEHDILYGILLDAHWTAV